MTTDDRPLAPPRDWITPASWLVVAATLAMLLVFVAGHSFSIYDDAYIYFRYADDLRDGCGPTFNCGDPPVEGFSSPLFLALLVLGGALGGDVEAWSQVLGPACLAVALGLAIRVPVGRTGAALAIARGPGLAAAAAVALLLGLDDYVLLNAVSGLETGLAAAVAVALLRAVLRREVGATATWSVVGVLARPELGVLVLLLPVLPWMRRRRAVLGVIGALVLITALRLAIFGDPLPNTYWAKSGGTAVHARLGAEYLAQVLRDFPFVALAPLALLDRAHRREHGFVLLGALAWGLAFLRTGGDHFAYGRLAFPLVPVLVAQAAVGLVHATARLEPRPWLRAAAVLLPALGVGARAQLQHGLAEGHGFANVQRWALVGRWLAEHHPGETIATVPVGAMAHASGLRTLDLVGITSREVARAGGTVPTELMRRNWLGHERHATQWVLDQAPELIVTTKFRAEPWRRLEETRAGFYADWLLLQEIKAGRAPYRIYDAEVTPGVHWLMFRRTADAAPTGPRLPPPPE
ncbi:MAG: hypothetical protein H6712_33985 [Myxococcales bacterium]|nr:hypothetical protein [Myxococcales bacterium]MCB9718904.1 hypothetical protein [Myxococcales bacterium]